MKHLFKFIVALGVFTMTIGSSFAMDKNPPTEPVKVTVETEVVDDVQPPLFGYGYKISPTQCVFLAAGNPGTDCSPMNTGVVCTQNVSGTNYNLFLFTRISALHPWICTNILIRKEL